MTWVRRAFSSRVRFSALSVASAVALSGAEGSAAWLLSAVPLAMLWADRRVLLTDLAKRWSVFLTVIAMADVALVTAREDSLGVRVWRLTDTAEKMSEGDPRVIPGRCPQYHFRPGDHVDPGPPRDALGRLVMEVPGANPLKVLLVGDSVMQRGAARLLHQAFAAAGQPVVIVDTSAYGYRLSDYGCVLDESLPDLRPDLVIVGMCVNDMPMADFVEVDVGHGMGRYDWRSVVVESLSDHSTPPLLLESASPWVRARRAALEERWPGRLTFDVAGPEALSALSDELRNADDVRFGALRGLDARLRDAHVPIVAVMFPLLYQVKPSPVAPVVDAFLSHLRDAPYPIVNLQDMYSVFAVQDLVQMSSFSAFSRGEGMYDVIHVNDAGMSLALGAAMSAAALPEGWDKRDTIVRQLTDRAQAALPCGGFSCDPTDLGGHHGPFTPEAMCRATGEPSVCHDTPATSGTTAPETPSTPLPRPATTGADRGPPPSCVPMVKRLTELKGATFVDIVGKVMQMDLAMTREDMDAFCSQNAQKSPEEQLRAVTKLTGLDAPP